MTQQTDIKRLSDGSIDLAHYTAKGCEIRSNDTHRWLTAMWRTLPWRGKPVQPGLTLRRGSDC